MIMRGQGWKKTLLGLALLGMLAGCEPISEPWISGSWGERLENERTRDPEQQRELQRRLQYYGAAYR